MNDKNRLEGLKSILMARCSTAAQAATSTDDQLAVIRSFMTRQKMEEIDVVRLDGLSASNPVNIDGVIDELVKRKTNRDDFDALVVQDQSRLTRSGSDHAGAIRYRLAQLGIRVVYAANHVEDPMAEAVIRAV